MTCTPKACIIIGGEEYQLQNLFPILGRKLRRRNSEAQAVSGVVEAPAALADGAESSLPDLDGLSVRSGTSASSKASPARALPKANSPSGKAGAKAKAKAAPRPKAVAPPSPSDGTGTT